MDKTAEDLKVRTKRFAIAVLDFVDTLPRTHRATPSPDNSPAPGLESPETIAAPAAAALTQNSPRASGLFSKELTRARYGSKSVKRATTARPPGGPGCWTSATSCALFSRRRARPQESGNTRSADSLGSFPLPPYPSLPAILQSCNPSFLQSCNPSFLQFPVFCPHAAQRRGHSAMDHPA